jgi:CxxC motif-containing protein
MIKKLVCIECPQGCILSVDMDDNKIVKLTGNKCPKGEKYALSEIENPVRILTSTVLTEGMPLKMIPVRTDKPISKNKIFEAMKEIRRIRVKASLNVGDIIVKDLVEKGVNLVATRDCLVA